MILLPLFIISAVLSYLLYRELGKEERRKERRKGTPVNYQLHTCMSFNPNQEGVKIEMWNLSIVWTPCTAGPKNVGTVLIREVSLCTKVYYWDCPH